MRIHKICLKVNGKWNSSYMRWEKEWPSEKEWPNVKNDNILEGSAKDEH